MDVPNESKRTVVKVDGLEPKWPVSCKVEITNMPKRAALKMDGHAKVNGLELKWAVSCKVNVTNAISLMGQSQRSLK